MCYISGLLFLLLLKNIIFLLFGLCSFFLGSITSVNLHYNLFVQSLSNNNMWMLLSLNSLSYLWLVFFVEMDIFTSLAREVWINPFLCSYWYEVEFEGFPSYCKYCKFFVMILLIAVAHLKLKKSFLKVPSTEVCSFDYSGNS